MTDADARTVASLVASAVPLSAIEAPLAQAEAQGFLSRSLHTVTPTARGFDFLNDLQSLFLADAPD